MLNYAPYANLATKDYPPTLIIGGLKAFQTPYWQIIKYGVKLRQLDTDRGDEHLIYLPDIGHGGSFDRYIRLEQEVYMYLFMKWGR